MQDDPKLIGLKIEPHDGAAAACGTGHEEVEVVALRPVDGHGDVLVALAKYLTRRPGFVEFEAGKSKPEPSENFLRIHSDVRTRTWNWKPLMPAISRCPEAKDRDTESSLSTWDTVPQAV